MSQVKIEESLFGVLPKNQQIKKYVLTNQNGFSVSLISFGASIHAVNVKDKNGKLTNVCLGFNTIEEYANPDLNPYFGAIIGRATSRISNAEFNLNGFKYQLDKNSDKHCLHGGNSTLSRKNWASAVVDNYVKFSIVSGDGEGGFPGEVWIDVFYKLDPNENKLTIEYKAITDKPTPINLTNHFFFNLNGHESNLNTYNHLIKINSDKYLDFNPDCTVTGKINSVENTKYDLREFTLLSDRIKKEVKWPEDGYDNYYIANDSSEFKKIASVKNPSNGLTLDLETNQLGVHFYSGNFLDINNNSNGAVYKIHHSFSLETSNYPDSVNHESFPSCILGPDDEYYQKTSFIFSIDS